MENVELLERTGLENQNLDYFCQLQDLKVKCEDFVETFPRQVFQFLLECKSKLKMVQFIAPLEWMNHRHVEPLCNKFKNSLEMLIICNTSDSQMNLGMDTVNYFVDHFPNLTVLGNLRTWRMIDYFDSNSTNYFRSESELSQLKECARKKNWDIDFELENLDFVTN
jgi:hypothetical protein